MTFVLTATKVLNILSKTLKDAVSGFFEFYSLREGGGLLRNLTGFSKNYCPAASRHNAGMTFSI